jgi:signal transduction histidine kinase
LKRSITTRMLVASGVLALMVGAVFVVLVLAISEQRDSANLAVRSQQAISAGTRLEKLVVDLETGVRGYVASGRESFLRPYREARQAYRDQTAQLVSLLSDTPNQQRHARLIGEQIDDYVNLYSVPMIELAREQPSVARSVIVNGTGRERVEEIRALFRDLFATERAQAGSRRNRAEDRADMAIWLGVAGFVVVVGLTLLLTAYLGRWIVRPVRDVAGAAEQMASGDLKVRVPDDRVDEIGDLGRSFNTMAGSLEERTEDLERSNRELEQYAAVTSHDLKEPLQTVSIYAQLLSRNYRDTLDDEGRRNLDNILTGTESMRTLIRDLLEYSRVGNGTLRAQPVETDPLVLHALDNLAGTISDKGAEVTKDRLPVVRADPKQLGQVFQNLLSNALKFSERERPAVHVGVTRENGAWRFSVRDNGIGIDPANAERIFEPFARVGGGYEGTGIGLAICQKIIEHHGGRIWVDSSPGSGSTFHFTIPAGN